MVQCIYPGDSIATGFQVIAQLSNSSKVHRLDVNKTTDRQTPVTVLVEEDGQYLVTIFAIGEQRGILDSNIEDMTYVMINDSVAGVETTTGISFQICLLAS